MNGAEITAIVLGVPAIIGAITSLIVALRGSSRSEIAVAMATRNSLLLNKHLEPAKAAAAADREKVLAVPCPRCGARTGSCCLSQDGVPINLIHGARVVSWQAQK
jgi:hypothetical protein